MTEGGRCARHPGRPARRRCARCGDNACGACARADLCPDCRKRVETEAPEPPGCLRSTLTDLARAALFEGCVVPLIVGLGFLAAMAAHGLGLI